MKVPLAATSLLASIWAQPVSIHQPLRTASAAMQVSEAQSEDELKRRYLAHVETALALKPGAVVADIGSGDTPEFLPFLSKAVGQSGKVICVDIHEKALEKLRHYLEENGATNAQTHLGKPDDPML